MKYIYSFFLLLTVYWVFAQESYRVELDLLNVRDDRVAVRVDLPTELVDTAVYQMPVIIPGTYSVANYGRYVTNLEAFDRYGEDLAVQRMDENSWQLPPGASTVSYFVEDTFDDFSSEIFEPAGTNFEKGENFLLNIPGIIGFIQSWDTLPYELFITHPDSLYGVASLFKERINATQDRFIAEDYFQLHDNPIMYALPDTASAKVGGTTVAVSSYSPSGKLSASFILENVVDLFHATYRFLGDTLPAETYLIINYGFSELRMAYGALEHWNCTVMTLPDVSDEWMVDELRNIVAHEFLHIITPLNIHSDEVENFDFVHPEMSKHLWLYEGVTEYLAHYVQLIGGIISLEEFVERMEQKIWSSTNNYNPYVSFTSLSTNCIDVYPDQYGNVYEKGALIGFMLDLHLRQLSNGKTGLADLLLDLSERYGQNRSFDEDELFSIIAEMTDPEIRTFFAKYVESAEPLPMDELLEGIGITYRSEMEVQKFSVLGNVALRVGRGGLLEVSRVDEMNAYGRNLGIQKGDLIRSINGVEVSFKNFEEVIPQIKSVLEVGQKMEVVVERNDGKRSREITLTAPARQFPEIVENYITIERELTSEQRQLRKAWMENN
jgi:predicted metalloprotease with PDZ domain